MTVMKAFVVVAVALAVVSLIPSANADFYIQHPRGSNNKLNEQNNNRRNQNRLFDSQNNANAGYNVGDECDGICHPDPLTRTYDSTIPGAGEGEMKYYENSYLYIEWTAQHGCGNENENTYCDIVFQFLCDDEVRNGRITPTNNGANNPDVAPLDRELAQSWDYGRHESWEFYYNCSHRIRNRGLFFGTLPNNIEDRQEENRDYAVYTRQDNNGPNDDGNGRYGFECPEERDYYPYWHPTEWIDIVVLTSSPARCGMYRSESQNVMNKGTCSNTLYNNPDACVGVDPVTGRQSNGTWEEQPSWDDIEDLDELFPDFPFDDIDAPPCEGTAWSRDNHHGNGLDGQMAHYMWQLPELKDGVDEARCVLRGRYNNTSDDYPGWETFSEANADPPIKGNPNADFLKVGVCLDSNDNEVRHYTSEECLNDLDDDYRWIPRERELRLAQNPAQFSRVFEDRTHMFKIIARPPGIADVTPIYNLNVRGRRGNIQQTYPAVEYDFTPPNLVVEQNSYIHFQWTGSDSNPNNAGQGRERTDRSNLVQIESLNKNFPIPYADNTMFKTGLLGGPDYEVIDRLAFLGQPAQNCCVKCNNDEKNDDEAEPPRCCNRENTLANDEQDFRFCGLMHMAPAYFNGGLVKMYAVGTFHFMSTRNNAYTNRSQKGTITVRVDPKIVWGVVGGIAGVAGVAAALTAAAYVYGAAHEASMCATCFTLSCRKFPCCCLCYFRTPQRALKEEEEAIAAQEKSSFRRWLAENNLKLKWLALYIVLNIGIGLYGFCTNYFIQGWSNLFRKDNTVPIWFPLAKTGGAILNLNCSLILLPVLRNFISWLRLTPLSSHIPLDSNIGFHKLVAFFIFLGSTIHVVFHYINFVSQRVSDSVPLYTTALNWAGATGHLILLGMILIFSTAAFSKIRRGRCGCKRGFDLFFNVHKLYVPIFILLWTHGQKFWLWSMWPIGLFVIEKVIRHVRSRSTTKLVSCKWVQSDVIRIRFSVKQFNYTPGQYLYINCPSVSKNEWHPFTITSAPEDDYVECHIKCKGHWTVPFGNLMVNTYNHWKKTDGSGSGSGSGSSSSVAITQNKHTVTGALDVPITTIPIRAREALGNPEIDPTMDLVRVDGPYGSASEYVFDYPVVVLVGAGIGVTPFASIMKAIKIRIKQRHCGECRARHDHSMEKEIFPKRVYFHWMCRSKEEFLWFAFLLNSIKDDGAISDIFDFKTYMTGGLDLETFRANIIRQHNAKKGKGKGGSSSGSGSGSYTEAQESYASSLSYPTTVSGSVEITEQEEEEEEGKSKSGKKKDSSGTSSESEMAQLMQDEFLNVSNIGRPKFVKIFSDLKKKVPKGTEVGIFLCGPEAVAQAISKATFAVNTYKEGDTMFTFHKENF